MIPKKTEHSIKNHKSLTTSECEWYRENVVWGFYEEKIPQYIQGKAGESEICHPVTAEEITSMQNTIIKLRKHIKDLKDLTQGSRVTLPWDEEEMSN